MLHRNTPQATRSAHHGHMVRQTLRTWRTALAFAGMTLASLLSVNAQAGIFTLDTSALGSTSARLEINLFDGDGITGNSTATAFGQSVTDFGQILHDFTTGGLLSIQLGFHGEGGDTLIISLLDAVTNFSLVDTNVDALEAPVPYEDALLVCGPPSGVCLTATASDPSLSVSFVPEPATTWLLLGALPAAVIARRRGHRGTRST